MTNIDKATVIPLFGTIPCHECGLPAQWYVNGATLPCRCSVRSSEQLADMLALIARYKDVAAAMSQRAQMLRRAELERQTEAQRQAIASDRAELDRMLNPVLDQLTKVVLPA